MRIGLYFFVTLVFIGIVGLSVYTINPATYTLSVMGMSLELLVALWFTLPLFTLFLFTLLYILLYGLRNMLLLKKWHKDTLLLEEALFASLIQEPKEAKYAIEDIGSVAVLLTQSSIELSDNVEGLSPKLSRMSHMIQKIKNGEYVDFKEQKFDKLFTETNPLLIKNYLNRLKVDEEFVDEVMRSNGHYPAQIEAEALKIFSQQADFIQAKKYIRLFNEESLLRMLKRLSSDNRLLLTLDILNEFVEILNLTCHDFVTMATITKRYFTPEENLTLFYTYQTKSERAQNAYLYLLFEYELLEEVSEYLQEQGEGEFKKFRALYILKREHHGYKFDDIIDIKKLCKESKG
jgi:hypothetical protein